MKKKYLGLTILFLLIFLTSCGGSQRGTKLYQMNFPENIIKLEMTKYQRKTNNNDDIITEEHLETIDKKIIEKMVDFLNPTNYKKTYDKINKEGYYEKLVITLSSNTESFTYTYFNYSGFYGYIDVDNKILYSTSYRFIPSCFYMFEGYIKGGINE